MDKKYYIIPHWDYRITVVWVEDYKKYTRTFNAEQYRDAERFVERLQNKGYNLSHKAL